MPTYNFHCKNCGLEEEITCKMSELDRIKAEGCDNCNTPRTVVIGEVSFSDPIRLGIRKPDDGFREVLAKINEANPRGHLNEKLSRN